jgi:archaellum biogenesis protein FlaJ (TadC family)
MKKTFCDCCGEEIRTVFKSNGLPYNITFKNEVEFNLTSESDICIHCVIDSLNRLDDRDKAAPSIDRHIDNCNEIKDKWVNRLARACDVNARNTIHEIITEMKSFKFKK